MGITPHYDVTQTRETQWEYTGNCNNSPGWIESYRKVAKTELNVSVPLFPRNVYIQLHPCVSLL